MCCSAHACLPYQGLQRGLMKVCLQPLLSQIYCSPCLGNIASLVVQHQFKETFGLSTQSDADYANTKGWIVAIATAGAVFGCLMVCENNQVEGPG